MFRLYIKDSEQDQASCVIGLHVLTSYVLLSYAYQHYIDVCRLIMQSSSYDFFGGLVSGIKKCDRPNNGMPKVYNYCC